MPHLLIAPSKWDTNAADDDHSLSLVLAAKILTSDQVLAVVDPAWNGPIWAPSERRPDSAPGVMPHSDMTVSK